MPFEAVTLCPYCGEANSVPLTHIHRREHTCSECKEEFNAECYQVFKPELDTYRRDKFDIINSPEPFSVFYLLQCGSIRRADPVTSVLKPFNGIESMARQGCLLLDHGMEIGVDIGVQDMYVGFLTEVARRKALSVFWQTKKFFSHYEDELIALGIVTQQEFDDAFTAKLNETVRLRQTANAHVTDS